MMLVVRGLRWVGFERLLFGFLMLNGHRITVYAVKVLIANLLALIENAPTTIKSINRWNQNPFNQLILHTNPPPSINDNSNAPHAPQPLRLSQIQIPHKKYLPFSIPLHSVCIPTRSRTNALLKCGCSFGNRRRCHIPSYTRPRPHQDPWWWSLDLICLFCQLHAFAACIRIRHQWSWIMFCHLDGNLCRRRALCLYFTLNWDGFHWKATHAPSEPAFDQHNFCMIGLRGVGPNYVWLCPEMRG